MPNRLATSASPYLLSHAGNPVDWYAWGPEAFEAARRDDRPIFLSVGYATCHWCHVMERESFVDPETASFLNRHFVSVKVDREELPAVDRLYMTFVQATTGRGGWPMSVWLTPDLEPFFGGTYFPSVPRPGLPAFREVLEAVLRAWRDDRGRVGASARALVDRLAPLAAPSAEGLGDLSAAIQARGRDALLATEDRRAGGFGDGPRFPRPAEVRFLLRHHARTGHTESLAAARRTAEAWCNGGLRDQLGGGFHRYTVDAEWRIPHFEKMLHDQAQIAVVLLDLAQATGEPAWASVATETLDYVLRDLGNPEGGFYCGEDADSVPGDTPGAHAEEGAWYTWTLAELAEVLGEQTGLAALAFGLVEPPTKGHPASPAPGGRGRSGGDGGGTERHVLRRAMDPATLARHLGQTPAEGQAALTGIRDRLRAARDARPRPLRDDKILAAWNGLTLGALARASRVLPALGLPGAERFGAAARATAAFLQRHLWNPQTGTLSRRFFQGRVGAPGTAADHAFLAWGLLELVQLDGEATDLAWATLLGQVLDERFGSPEGGWYDALPAPDLLLRTREAWDGAEPAPTSVASEVALGLARLRAEPSRIHGARDLLASLAPPDAAHVQASPWLAGAVEEALHGGATVVVTGSPTDPATRALRAAVSAWYRPFLTEIPLPPGSSLPGLLPWLLPLAATADRPAAFVCRGQTCGLPVFTAPDLAAALDG